MGVQLDSRVSLGNVLLLVGMLAGGFIAWGKWTSMTETISGELSKNAVRLEGHEARIRVIETTTARQDERMILILDSLRKIENRLERSNP